MDEVDAFLAHHGVRGMKWGRHQTKSKVTVAKKPRTAAENAVRSAKRKKILKTSAKVAGGVALAAGAAVLAYHLKQSGNVQASALMGSIAKSAIGGAKAAASQPHAPAGNTSLTLSPNRVGSAPRQAPHVQVAAGKNIYADLMKQQSNFASSYNNGRSSNNSLINSTNAMLANSRL